MDRRSDYLAHLSAMAGDKRTTSRIQASILKVHQALRAATDRKAATGDGSRNDSLTMRIRQFHDELGLHVRGTCVGALYRSAGALSLEDAGTLRSSDVRCEHVVPATIVSGILWDRFRDLPVEDTAELLLRRTVVAAITRREDHELLGIARSYDDGRPLKWKSSHPDYLAGAGVVGDAIRPFRRYHGTGIRIMAMPTGDWVDLETFTMADHDRLLAGLALYDPGAYDLSSFGEDAVRPRTHRPRREASAVPFVDCSTPAP